MDTAIRFQIMDETGCISHSTNTCSLFCFMNMLDHMLWNWHFMKLTDWGCNIKYIVLISHPPTNIFPSICTLFFPKTFRSKGEVKLALMISISQNLKSFLIKAYCTIARYGYVKWTYNVHIYIYIYIYRT